MAEKKEPAKGFKGLMESKKFLYFAIGMVAQFLIATKFIDIPAETIESLQQSVLALTGAGIVGQGIADHGKEKAKVEGGK